MWLVGCLHSGFIFILAWFLFISSLPNVLAFVHLKFACQTSWPFFFLFSSLPAKRFLAFVHLKFGCQMFHGLCFLKVCMSNAMAFLFLFSIFACQTFHGLSSSQVCTSNAVMAFLFPLSYPNNPLQVARL